MSPPHYDDWTLVLHGTGRYHYYVWNSHYREGDKRNTPSVATQRFFQYDSR